MLTELSVRSSQNRWRNIIDGVYTDGLNGYKWNGTTLHCILQYPWRTWVIHPTIEPPSAPPLVGLYRRSLGPPLSLQPQMHPSYNHGRPRTSSLSSASSQASSSVGCLTPPMSMSATLASPGTSDFNRELQEYIHSRSYSAIIDITTGRRVSTSDAAMYETNMGPRHHQRVLLIDDAVPSPVEPAINMAYQPHYNTPVEYRSIIIRELDRTVNKTMLEDFLRSQNLRGECRFEDRRSDVRIYAFVDFASYQEALDAKRRLNTRVFAGRQLNVEIATEPSHICRDSRARASSLTSEGSAVSSNTSASSSGRRQRRGPILVDGSIDETIHSVSRLQI